MQHRHEKEIEGHVEHPGGSQRRQGNTGLPHAAEDGRLEIVQEDDRHPRQIDAQIEQRQGEDVRRDVEHPQQGRRDELPQHGHQPAPQEGDQHRGVHRLVHVLLRPLADGVGDDHIGPQGDADEQIDDEADNGAVGPHRCHRRRALRPGEVAHHRHVGGVEQLLQNRRRRHRESESGQLVPDGAVEHIQLFFAFCRFHEPRSLRCFDFRSIVARRSRDFKYL